MALREGTVAEKVPPVTVNLEKVKFNFSSYCGSTFTYEEPVQEPDEL